MDSITLENFRCFREKQTARLAPLTLLVGENSTGKTSFLAMIRALWDIAFGQRVPDFKEDPYDLGSFRDIAHRANNSILPADSFLAGFELLDYDDNEDHDRPLYFETKFVKGGTRPIPIRRCFSSKNVSIEEVYDRDRITGIRLTTPRGSWKQEVGGQIRFMGFGGRSGLEDYLTPVIFYLHHSLHEDSQREAGLEPLSGSPDFSETDLQTLGHLIDSYDWPPWLRPFASAPVRSKPHRTYDPSRPARDSEGDYIPMYLANLHSQDRDSWKELRSKLEKFGGDAGLFDKIVIKQLGERDGGPFQIQIRKTGIEGQGPGHNLIDVGYGVNQVLPLITELLRTDAPNLFLLQQPEVHLHPSAQAALGSLFCQVAGQDRQLVVETHSDYILDRVRMDIRDGVSYLTPDDISVLFFERNDMDVNIHSLRFDEEGNVLGSPEGYRDFFMRETRRSLGL